MIRKLLIGVLGVLVCFNGFAFAQEPKFPTKPIRMVVGYAPGGGSDIMGRLIAPHITKALGQPIIVENKPGAAQNVAAVNWSKKPTRTERATLTGCYVIETNHLNLEAPEIWGLYTTLTQVEAAFRDLKTDLGLRPIYHHLAERTKAHLFISVLAYHLLISIEQTLRQKGDHRRWSTILEQLGTHQRITVNLTDAQKRIHQCRASSMPELVHQEIYQLLGVKDPLKRLNRLAGTRL